MEEEKKIETTEPVVEVPEESSVEVAPEPKPETEEAAA